MKKICEKCGKEIKEGSKYCQYCGAKIQETKNKDTKEESKTNQDNEKHIDNKIASKKSKITETLKNNKTIIFIIFIVLILCICLFISILALCKNDNAITYGTHENVNITESNTIKKAIDKVYNAVVYVESSRNNTALSSGSGFIYKKDKDSGYIMTNYHVIENASAISVTTMTGEEVKATAVGGDAYSDVAVLKIDASKVPDVASIGDSTKSEVGDTVFTVGTPIDKEYMGTVTKGILSNNAKTITVNAGNTGAYKMEVLQTDASINPGNSGGPLVNINGEVIGITSMKLVTTEIEGMGFAIPIEVAMSNVENLENGKSTERPYIGVSLYDLDNIMMYRYGVQTDGDVKEGTVIAEVEKNSPADKAELKANDIITAIDGEKVTDSASLKYILYKHSVGDTITLKVYRNGKDIDIKVKLDKSTNN